MSEIDEAILVKSLEYAEKEMPLLYKFIMDKEEEIEILKKRKLLISVEEIARDIQKRIGLTEPFDELSRSDLEFIINIANELHDEWITHE